MRRLGSASLAPAASVASFVGVALVASVPGSPFAPVLPSPPAGPFRVAADALGLDAVHGSALVAIGVVAVALAAGAFVLLLRETWRGAISPKTVLALAVAYHVALLFLPLLFSRDVYSYAFYGKIAATYHANPYVVTPADFRGDVLASFVGPKWFDTPAVYGPLWTQVSALVVRLAGTVASQIVAFRILAIAASLATVVVVSRLVRRAWPDREAFATAALGANPVVLFQSAASGHNDLLVAFAVSGGLALAFARRELAATAALTLGALVKVTAGVPLALYVVARVAARPRGQRLAAAVRHGAVAVGLAAVATLPFLNARDPTLGVLELAGHEGWLAPSRFVRRVFEAVGADALGVIPRLVFPLFFVAAAVAIGRELVRRAPSTPFLEGSSWGWGLACLMLLGPVLLPWYAVWALPVVWLLPATPRALLLATGVALTLSQWTSEPAAFPAAYDANLLFGHYVLTPLVLVALGVLLVDLRRRTRSAASLEDEPEREPAADREH